MHTNTSSIGCPFLCDGSVVVVDALFIVAPVFSGNFVFVPCFVMQYLVSFLVLQSC